MRAPPPDRPFLRVAYGEQELEFMLQPWFDVLETDGPADIVVGGLGGSPGATLSDALAAALPLVERVRPGGAAVLAARLEDGAGEQDLEALTGRFGERCLVIVAASEAPEAVRLAGLRAAVDVEEALDIAFEHLGRPQRARVLLVPRVR